MAETGHPSTVDPMRYNDGTNIEIELCGLVFSVHTGPRPGRVDVSRIADGRLIEQFRVDPAPADEQELLDAARVWMERRVGAVAPPAVHCRGCGTELAPAMNRDTDYQFDNALWVTFSGGYSMFIDPADAEDRGRMKVVLCHGCAHDLCEKVPWIDELLDPERSHAHLAEHHAELIAAGHRGWDLQQ